MKQWFYVVDGQQQGPVSEADLQGLVISKKIAPDTFIWSEGMSDWVAIKDVSELAPMMQLATRVAATPAFAPGQVTAPGFSSPVPAEELTVGSAYSEAWTIFKDNFMNACLLMLAWIGIIIVMGIFQGIATAIGGRWAGHLVQIATTVIQAALTIGLWTVILQLVDGEEFKLSDIFSRFDQWWMSFLTYLVYIIMIFIGLILLIIPGIVVAIMFMFWSAICADEGKGSDFFGSLKKSYEIVKPKFFTIIGIGLLSIPICIVGFLLLFIGIIPASAFLMIVWGVAYRRLRPKF